MVYISTTVGLFLTQSIEYNRHDIIKNHITKKWWNDRETTLKIVHTECYDIHKGIERKEGLKNVETSNRKKM